MRASRLLGILLLLQARGRLTAPQLAAELEVSVRTIYRDIDELSAAGIPVYADRGATGGFRLLDGYHTRLTGLTTIEAGALGLFGLPKAAADLGLGEALTSARRKLDAALPDSRRQGVETVSSRFLLDTSGWFKPIERPEFLPAIADAVWQVRRFEVRYRSWNAESTKVIAPVGIVLKAGVWYVVAIGKRGEPATYRVSSIKSLTVLDESFERPLDFDLNAYWERTASELAARLHKGSARLRVSPRGFDLIGKLGIEVAQAAERTRGALDAEAWSEVEIPVEHTANAVLDMLSLGGEAILLGPETLVKALKETLGQLTALYQSSDGAESH